MSFQIDLSSICISTRLQDKQKLWHTVCSILIDMVHISYSSFPQLVEYHELLKSLNHPSIMPHL